MENNKTAERELTCAICGNIKNNRIHHAREMMLGLRDRFRYVECFNCRCVQLIDVPDDMTKYYPKNYYAFVPQGGIEGALKKRWAAQAIGRWSLAGWMCQLMLGPHLAMTSIRRAEIPLDARILDVGCGVGWLIRDMKKIGYRQVSGMDPYIEDDLRDHDGVLVKKCSLHEMTGEFDVIMLHHSFEHLADQAGALNEIRRLLSPTGRILIRIPIADSYAWKHYGINWMHLDAPRHLFLHSPTSMRLLAKACGLQVSELIYEGNASQFVCSEQYAKDVALVDQRSGSLFELRRWVGLWRSRKFKARAEELNRTGQGDWGCFILQIPK
jgi:SAM-dependent methyltransferase